MAQIPYSPVPTVAPSEAPTPGFRLNTPEGAFGGGVAGATQGLGQSISSTGNELFGRAMAMQQVNNEAEKDNKVSSYIRESGELDNKFRQLSGSQPQEALNDHIKALSDLRDKYADSVSNPMVKKGFDSETIRRYSYDVINANNYAATQGKQFAKTTQQNLRDTAKDSLVRDPSAENWNTVVGTIAKSTAYESQGLDGEDKQMSDRKFSVELGKAALVRAGVTAKHDPDGAQDFLDKIKDKLIPTDIDRIQEVINTRGVQTNAAVVGARLMGPDSAIIDRAMLATKGQESGGRYNNVTTTTNAKTGQPQSALGAYGIMEDNVGPWSKEILGKEVSRAEFLASPTLQDQIYRGKMGQYIDKYGVEGAGRAWLGGEGAVNAPDRSDAFGTTVGNYGSRFASLVGGAAPGEAQRLVTKMALAEQYANKLYPPDKDPALNAAAVTQFQHAISVKASVQQKELNDTIHGLRNDVSIVMNTQTDKNRPPTSMEEANAVNPNFQATAEQLAKLDPGAAVKLNNWFKANANVDNPATYERETKYQQYLGMSDEDRRAYDANDAFNKGEITNKRRNDINIAQAKEQHDAESNIKVDSILNRHRDMLNDAKIYPSRDNKAANTKYTQLRGALILELRDAQANGAMVKKPEEEDRIMQKLLGQLPTGNNSRFFGIPIPGTTETKPTYETESLLYPTTVQSTADALKLRSGQHYILNGQRAIRK